MTHLEKFKNSVTVLDTETTDIDPARCELVEIAGAVFVNNTWQIKSTLLGAYGGMPPEASAKNNISNRMINGLPPFDKSVTKIKDILNWPNNQYYVAHNANYDMMSLKTAFARISSSDDEMLSMDKSRWICTYRLSQQILFEENMQYSLGYLRYKLDLPIDDNTGTHRAADDTLVCAKLLEVLIDKAVENGQVSLNEDIGKQLCELSWQHIQINTWPFGKNRGKKLYELSDEYYIWALKNIDSLQEDNPAFNYDLAESVRSMLENRLNEIPF